MNRFEPEFQKIIDATESLAIGDYTKMIDDIDLKIKELEKEKKKHYEWISQFVQNIKEPIYFIWYYVEDDIDYNGGVRTFTTKSEFIKLLEYYNNDGLFIVDARDVVESIKQQKVVYPEFLDERYLKMIRNPEYNEWHKQLLENENLKWKRI